MNLRRRPKIVLLGMMTKMPVAGVVWQTMHYLVGLERLGCDTYYVEQHARTPSMFMETEQCDGSAKAAAFIDKVMRRFDLGDRWCFHALHEPESRCLGMSDTQLRELLADADYIINLHGGTVPLPEHTATGRLVYVETDPVQLQIELHDGVQETVDFLAPHCAFFTFGENIGNPDCDLPAPKQFNFIPTRQPVVCDLWDSAVTGGERFTTIGNWAQHWRPVQFRGHTYTWSKHFEFLKFIELPSRTAQPFELALSSYTEADKAMLEGKGWHIRHGLDVSTDMDIYRRYISESRGEFTVAKDQNVRLRSGWFSDRAATFLAAGRPVVTQETGFSNVLPTGEGLFGFSTMDEILAAVDEINGDYERHCRAAKRIARECFGHDVVLGPILDALGISTAPPRALVSIPRDLALTPVSRRPIRLPERSVRTVESLPLPPPSSLPAPNAPRASVVIVTFNNLILNRLGLLNLLDQTPDPDVEIFVVDNASTDGTADFLRELAAREPRLKLLLNPHNAGFSAACNQGLREASGGVLILLNNDTLVARGWVQRLAAHLSDPSVALAGAVTNRIGNEAEIPVDYATYGGFLRFARERQTQHAGGATDIPMAAMFCVAMRRDTLEKIGPLDEQFEIGMFEDDDYAMRARAAGLRVICAEDVFVHHFGEASFGGLCASGEYGGVFAANRARFEKKWGIEWRAHAGREKESYRDLVARVHRALCEHTPATADLLIVSRGDDTLLDVPGRKASHFPQGDDGGYAGHYPADAGSVIAMLDSLRAKGANGFVIPETSAWWLDHYGGLRDCLMKLSVAQAELPGTCRIFLFHPHEPTPQN